MNSNHKRKTLFWKDDVARVAEGKMRGQGGEFEARSEIKVQRDVTGGPSSIEHHFLHLGMTCLHAHVGRLAILTGVRY
jgi:hypothetical protein